MKNWPDMRSPGVRDADAIAFAKSINDDAELELVRRIADALPMSNCYWNVDRVANERGGSMVLGWAITKWPRIVLEAMHHAVWKTPEGKLLDVTKPYPPTLPGRTTTFLRDQSIEIDLHTPQCTPNLYQFLIETPETRAYSECCARYDEARKRVASRMVEYGYKCEQQFALATGEVAKLDGPPWTDEQREANDRLRREMDIVEQMQASFIPIFRNLAKSLR